ncbi:MAG: MFS transporter [Anaerolineales bacterium]
MSLSQRLGVNRIVLAISFARMADALGNSILFIVLPLYVAELPAPMFEKVPEPILIGSLISVYGLVFSVLLPVMGAWSDRVSRRKPVIQLGLLMMGLGILAFLLADRFAHLMIIRIVQGLGVAITVPAALGLMATSTEHRTRGGSMGVYSALRMVGFATGPIIGGFLQVHYGFPAVFITGSSFVLLSVGLVQIWVDEPARPVISSQAEATPLINWHVFTRDIVSLGAATFIMASAFSMITTLENEFNALLQQTAIGFGIAFSALTITRLFFQIPLGRLSDRIGRKPVIIGGLLLMAPATGLLGYVTSTLQLTGLRGLQGLASAAIAAPAFALAGDLSLEGGEGQQMGLLAMGFGLGIAVGPMIAGALAVISFQLPFIIGGAMSLVGIYIVHRFVPETIGPGAISAD